MKKIVSAFLIISMLMLCISCQTNSENLNNDNEQPDTSETAGITEPTTEEKILPNLPEMDFAGQEIVLFGRALETSGVVKNYSEADSEEENGEIMNDAIYKRNRTIEEKYNIKITAKLSSDYGSLSSEIKKSVNSGDKSFDAAFAGISDCAGLSSDSYLIDLKSVPYLDLEKPWWDQRAVDGLSIGGKLFFTLGDMTPWAHSFTHVIVFNKEMIQEYALESPYQLVRNNQWNLDKFYEYCVAVSGDTDGDGEITEFDRHGVMSAIENFVSHVISCGESLIKKDANDLPYIAINNERAASVASKVYDTMSDREATLLVDDYMTGYADPWFDVLRKQFRNGNGLFYLGGLEQILIFRDLETDIGILPIPKFDSNQKEYYHTTNTYWASTLSIPATNDNLEMTGFILEALAAESMYTVRPAYYDVTLTRKMMRDEDSIEMLEIILASRSFDLGMIYNWGGIRGIFDNMLRSKSPDFTSSYEKIQPRIETEMNKAVEKFING